MTPALPSLLGCVLPLRDPPEVLALGGRIRRARSLDGRADRFASLAPLATMDFGRPPGLK